MCSERFVRACERLGSVVPTIGTGSTLSTVLRLASDSHAESVKSTTCQTGQGDMGIAGHENEVKWKPEDLDRCAHGRHSIDPCYGCPGGWSTGNQFLIPGRTKPRDRIRTHQGVEQVRIGTTLRGLPIWVEPRRTLRGRTND